jgi:hypothetical protein
MDISSWFGMWNRKKNTFSSQLQIWSVGYKGLHVGQEDQLGGRRGHWRSRRTVNCRYFVVGRFRLWSAVISYLGGRDICCMCWKTWTRYSVGMRLGHYLGRSLFCHQWGLSPVTQLHLRISKDRYQGKTQPTKLPLTSLRNGGERE